MKRIARILSILLLLAALLSGTVGCIFSITPGSAYSPILTNRNPYKNLSGDIDVGDKTLVYQWSKENDDDLYAKIDELNALIADGTDRAGFLSAYAEAEAMLGAVTTQYQLAYIEYCLLGSSAEAEENYTYISDLRQDMVQKLVSMYQTIYDSPFRDTFYDGWSEEDIRSALDQSAMYTDALTELNKKDNAYLVAYRALNVGTDAAKIRELYLEFAKNKNEIARALGYDNYMEYAYESVYGRDYTPEDAETVVAFNRTYLTPLIEKIYDAFDEDYSADENTMMQATAVLGNSSFRSYEARIWLRKYLTALDDDAYSLYKKFNEQGNYFISSDSDSYAGAFTWYLEGKNKPIMYFGPDYQNIFTFVHEYGHYMSAIRSESDCMDVMETQSQANEMLFCRYLDTLYGEKVGQIVSEYQLFDALFGIAQQLIVNDFETYVYTHLDTIAADDLDNIYKASVMKIFGDTKLSAENEGDPMTGYDMMKYVMGAPPEIYWYYVAIESPGYYVSYATSRLMALELFAKSADGFDAAADTYMTLVNAKNKPFCEVMQSCGLSDPFDEETYRLIASVIQNSYLAGR